MRTGSLFLLYNDDVLGN